MAKNASERYDSAKEVSELLEECLLTCNSPRLGHYPKLLLHLQLKSRAGHHSANSSPLLHLLSRCSSQAYSLSLELNKGTLTIQSDSDDIRVRITRGDEVIDGSSGNLMVRAEFEPLA